ncbi:CMRF35-like molecule 8, partial [Galemys pyrenaicus]
VAVKEWGSMCFPGCWCLQGPRIVTGHVGGSLSVQCPYEKEYADYVKFWCKGSCWISKENIVKTSKAERKGRSGRMSIRDDPAKLTFTVTLEQLTEDDTGTYWCGVDSYFLDPKLQVEVSVSPAPRRSTPPATVTVTTTTTTTMQTTTPTSTALTTQRAAQGNSQPNLR